MSDPSPPAEQPEPPHTGVPQIDEALAGLPALAEAPLVEHHERLAQAHAVLADALSDQSAGEPDGQDDAARRRAG